MLPTNFIPAHSRRLATVIAAYVLVTTWAPLHSQLLVNAADVPIPASRIDTISQTVLAAVPGALTHSSDDNSNSDVGSGYVPAFDYFDRSLLGRQEAQEPPSEELKDNGLAKKEIKPGETLYFVLKRSQSRLIRSGDDALEGQEAQGGSNASGDTTDAKDVIAEVDGDDKGGTLGKRQAGNRVWVSANTCRQPAANGSETPKDRPQLVMYVSTSSKNQRPGPEITDNLVPPVPFDQGFASIDVNTTSDVYIGISAPLLSKDWDGSWSFHVAASVDGPYHSYNATNPFLYMIDTDSESALFITYNLSEPNSTDSNKWKERNPFSMYAFEVGDQSAITGMERSLCALRDLYSNSTLNSTTTITTKFGANIPKSQFHIQGLKNGTMYNGFLTVEGGNDVVRLPGGGVVRAGGMVFQNFTWTTKADDSCQVLFDLKFCDSVAYAVPSSSNFTRDDERLKKLYDEEAEKYYTNFTRSLAQVACDTASDAQYSLARTCENCAQDYKNWLCSVLIPRCENWSANDEWLQERNVNALLPDGSDTFGGNVSDAIKEEKRDRFAYSKSRNPLIDTEIKPGPYKEMKPCEDLCFDIVRSCPAQLGFACPNNPVMRALSYGKRDPEEKELKCNFPGAVVKLNVQGAAGSLVVRGQVAVLVAMLVGVFGWL
ncbi:hypothetical protein CC86DRAFT_455877 [Ophiobolus disseminans]|uniref:Calcium channel subunit Mid1 n=1 Tax=Ophiobolus disseminans TaxID=1469910 RepID=A0A6A6ZZ70_9PLEO|nr:hypothetical protein CC86DRAFT_455877 [Ophiobolus disseminans]